MCRGTMIRRRISFYDICDLVVRNKGSCSPVRHKPSLWDVMNGNRRDYSSHVDISGRYCMVLAGSMDRHRTGWRASRRGLHQDRACRGMAADNPGRNLRRSGPPNLRPEFGTALLSGQHITGTRRYCAQSQSRHPCADLLPQGRGSLNAGRQSEERCYLTVVGSLEIVTASAAKRVEANRSPGHQKKPVFRMSFLWTTV
jgi:hypothetical protein